MKGGLPTPGDRVTVTPLTGHRSIFELSNKPYPGTVVYVHPQGIFYTVEFKLHGRSFRERFYTKGRTYDR